MDFSKVGKMPTRRDVQLMDLDMAKKQITTYKKSIDDLLKMAEAHDVYDDGSARLAVEITANVKNLAKTLDEHRKKIVEEPNRFVKAVNAFAKGFTDELGKIESNLKTKIGNYQYQKELARREAEAKAQAEAKKLQDKLDKEADEKGLEKVVVPAPVLPKDDSMVRSDSGSAYTVRKWKGEIVDASILPIEFFSPDQKKVDEAVKAGIREIPGVRIWEDVQVGIRT